LAAAARDDYSDDYGFTTVGRAAQENKLILWEMFR
jgi:hypothetical protein